MRRRAIAVILMVCLVLEAIPVTTIAQPSPPIEFEGEIEDKDIRISKTEGGYEIGLRNNLWLSELDVFFDGNYQGTIPKGPTWKYFTADHRINHVIVAAAEGSYDEGRAWHRYLSEDDWPDTTPTPTPEEVEYLPDIVKYSITNNKIHYELKWFKKPTGFIGIGDWWFSCIDIETRIKTDHDLSKSQYIEIGKSETDLPDKYDDYDIPDDEDNYLADIAVEFRLDKIKPGETYTLDIPIKFSDDIKIKWVKVELELGKDTSKIPGHSAPCEYVHKDYVYVVPITPSELQIEDEWNPRTEKPVPLLCNPKNVIKLIADKLVKTISGFIGGIIPPGKTSEEIPVPPEKPPGKLVEPFRQYIGAIISTLSEIVTSLKEKIISIPPEQKAIENVENALDALSGMANAYSEFLKLIYEASGVEPPEGSEVKFDYHVLSSKFCKTVDEAQTYMGSEGIESTDMNEALELVRELELEKNGFCIVIVDYSFTGFGEKESGRYPIVCNEKGDPYWESWQFYENIKKEIEESYKEYK